MVAKCQLLSSVIVVLTVTFFCIACFSADCEVRILNFTRDITESESYVFLRGEKLKSFSVTITNCL